MKKYNQCGVYVIRNIENGKMYIGSTSNSFRKRWETHRKRLKENKHHSTHLQSAYNKYGKDCFEFQVIEVTSPDKARERESYYISLYNTLNPKFGYNTAIVNTDGTTSVSETTKAKLSIITRKMWEGGKFANSFKKRITSWNKGIKCNNISETRRNMFSSIEVYKDDVLIATFRSVTDLDEWTKENEIPGLTYSTDKAGRKVQGKKTTHLRGANIHRAIRDNVIYRGLKFKKCLPLSPEMGVVKWENCWNGEIPNQQPSQPLTKLEGSETNP